MGKSILVVDDDKGIQTVLQSVLEAEGYTVGLTDDGLIALEQLECKRFDLMMPRMDGYTFVKEFRQRGWHKSIPFVVISAHVRAKVDHLGANGFLTKPFDIDDLLDTIASLLPEADVLTGML